jgi:hypothetical protein
MGEAGIRSQAANIFTNAAVYIRRYGWQKTGMGLYGQPRCSMGALASAYRKQKWDRELATLMYRELYKELDGISLTQFNYQHNDSEKVVHLFESIAAKLRQPILQ